MARKGARGKGPSKGNHLADMSLPPGQRGRPRRDVPRKRRQVPAQLDHGNNPAARRKAREGEQKMERQRDDSWG